MKIDFNYINVVTTKKQFEATLLSVADDGLSVELRVSSSTDGMFSQWRMPLVKKATEEEQSWSNVAVIVNIFGVITLFQPNNEGEPAKVEKAETAPATSPEKTTPKVSAKRQGCATPPVLKKYD